jgi:flavin-dependent dehydrogenase
MVQRADVVIMGGGLAGLTLALQLRERFTDLAVTVLDRRTHPAPAAIHKVGESSVEIGAHYLDTVLGLKEHLETCQLRKFGFRFFFSDARADIDQVTELGASRYLYTPSYQLDRGIFENFLFEHARAAGATCIDRAQVLRFTLGEAGAAHEVVYEHAGREHCISARWLVDASGRAGLIKHSLGLAEQNGHDVNAVWFRVNHRIDVDTWSHDRDWLQRCEPPNRWLSTNHLVGAGYWVWLIPLSSGSHSVGIVADARMHPLGSMSTFERALEFLHRHQPRLAQELEARRGLLQDFRFLRHFSYGCRQVFSAARWALTGEAGVFLDPFYSPGSDFIAIANTYITELVARDRAAQPLEAHARLYEQFYLSFYQSTLSLFREQYALFGDPEVMPLKVIWDYTYYWGVLCQLFFQHRLTDLRMMGRVRRELGVSLALNESMQRFLRSWSRVSSKRNAAEMIDQAGMGWFAELNRGLRDRLDDEAFVARLRANCAQLQALARELVERALAQHPELDASEVTAQLDAPEARGPRLLYERAA